MTKVSLRAYNRQIEGMIEASQLDEAIAHCQHILKAYPMHVDTYKLLGKTFLEARRYADAADIFQRVLMVAPDDFVSHVGMSIIRDDEGKLDEAIWHMERAFEVQPSNAAIQSELKRLYGRRDGVEPPKIRLSRDALANMYSQGELFNQAIAETKAVLAEDPNRADLQVMLARAYYRAGKKVEAAEMAAQLLKKYPYCLDAVKILVDVLPDSPKSENTQVYRHRLGLLDPYSAFITGSAFNTGEVDEHAVILEKLDYIPGAVPTAAQPNWASSLGIKLDSEKAEENVPSWLNPAGEAQGPTAPQVEEKAEPAQPDDSVPAWMQAAGWQETTGKSQAGPIEPTPEASEDAIAPGIIPDWLQSMAPKDAEAPKAEEEHATEAPKDNAGDIPEWLKAMGTLRPDETINAAGEAQDLQQPAETAKPAEETDMPDWLKSPMTSGNDPANHTEEPASPDDRLPIPNPVESTADTDIPDWMKTAAPEENPEKAEQEALESGETVPSAALNNAGSEADVPEWMKTTATSEEDEHLKAAEPSELDATAPSEALRGPTGEAEIPDWLNSKSSPEEDSQKTPEELFELEETAPTATLSGPIESNEIPDWLKSSQPSEEAEQKGAEEPAAAEGIIPPADSGDLPDWLKSTPPTEDDVKARLEQELSVTKTMPTTSGKEPADENDLPDWLKNLGTGEETGPAKAENAAEAGQEVPLQLDQSNTEEGSLPDWLKPIEPADEEKTAVVPAQTQDAKMEELQQPQNLAGEERTSAPAETPAEPVPSAEEGSVPDWLSSIANEDIEAAKAEPEAESNTAAVPAEEASFPDWLTSLGSETHTPQEAAAEVPPEEGVVPPAQDNGFPDWLNSIPEPEKSDDELADTKPHQAVKLVSPQGIPQAPVPEPVKPDQTVTMEANPVMDAGAQAAAEPALPTEEKPASKAVQFGEDEPFKPTGEPKPLGIGDDAMGWLESLAARQGAKADELLTKPQERPADMPDWLKQEESKPETAATAESLPAESIPQTEASMAEKTFGETPAAVEEEPTEVPASTPMQESATAAVEETAVEADTPAESMTAEEEKGKPVTIEDDTLAWLESLAANQGAKPEELLTRPEERLADTPDWIKQATEENAADQETGTPAEVKPAESENIQGVKPPAVGPDVPDWLKDFEKPGEQEPAKAEDEFQDWLSGEQKTAGTEEVEEAPEETTTAASKPEEDFTPWMEEPEEKVSDAERTIPDEWIPAERENSAPQAIAEAEQKPVLEEKPAMEEPEAALTEEATTVETPEPAVMEEKPAAEAPNPPQEEPPAAKPIIKGTGMLARIPEGHQDGDNLAAAQAALEDDKPDDAMQEYGKLIKRGRLLDEVIHDLREAIYRYPVDVNTWQSLGDAYMRANRLQDALDAYTKAEELLR